MAKKPPPIIVEVEMGQWMMTFSDLLTLLLAFFVLLLTMSSMDDRKFKDAFGMFSGAFGTLAKQEQAGMAPDFIVPVNAPIPEILVSDLNDLLDRHLREQLDEQKPKPVRAPEPEEYKPLFETEVMEDGVEVRIAGDVLFADGSDELAPESIELLRLVAGEVADMSIPVRVQSYVPPRTIDRDLAWELSLNRAAAVTEVISVVRGVDPQKLSLIGYGRQAPRTLRVDREGTLLVLTFFTEDTDKTDTKMLEEAMKEPLKLDEIAPDDDVPPSELKLDEPTLDEKLQDEIDSRDDQPEDGSTDG